MKNSRDKNKRRLITVLIISLFLCNLAAPDLSFSLQVPLKNQPIIDPATLPVGRIEQAFLYTIKKISLPVSDIRVNISLLNPIAQNLQLIMLFDEEPPSDNTLSKTGKYKDRETGNWVVPCIVRDIATRETILRYEMIISPHGETFLKKLDELAAPMSWEEHIRAYLKKRGTIVEGITLRPYATRSSEAVRRSHTPEDELRPPFMRDTQKIIHSRAFSRSDGKTQVVPFPKPHDLTKRMSHIEMVTKVATAIGRSLGLNEDLIEAICKGHDLGHTPFGHEGEYALSNIAEKEGIGFFVHNAQGVRILLEIEELNLTLQVVDGILAHNGEVLSREYRPAPQKAWDEVMEEYRRCFSEKGFDRTIRPMTLEGCVMRISDIIAYAGRDMEDAIKTGLVKREDMPPEIVEVLGDTNGEIVNTLITDLVINSFGKDYLTFSEPVFNALNALKKFNYERIYFSRFVKNYFKDLPEAMRALFDVYLNDIQNANTASAIYRGGYIDHYMKIFPEAGSDPRRMIIDFIAGMTDKFFVEQIKERRAGLYERFFKDWFSSDGLKGEATDNMIYGVSSGSILEAKGLCNLFRTTLFSEALSAKTVVLAFDSGVGGPKRAELVKFLETFNDLKKSPQYRDILKNIEIVSSTANTMETNIQARLGDLQGDAEVFVFANLANKPVLDEMRMKTKLVYINEEGFPINAYYPILEIITISLAQFGDKSTIGKIGSILAKLNIMEPRFNEEKGILFFTLIPDAEELDPQELTRRYSELRRFLEAV